LIDANFWHFLKAISEPTRLKILKFLSIEELCVCDLARIFDVSQPAISQHMRRLKDVGLVNERREAQWVYYSLDRQHLNAYLEMWEEFWEQEPEEFARTEDEWRRFLKFTREGSLRTCK